jgi:hypothetical protein
LGGVVGTAPLSRTFAVASTTSTRGNVATTAITATSAIAATAASTVVVDTTSDVSDASSSKRCRTALCPSHLREPLVATLTLGRVGSGRCSRTIIAQLHTVAVGPRTTTTTTASSSTRAA